MANKPVSVERVLESDIAIVWLEVASKLGVSWEPLGPVGNGRMRSYRFTARVDRLFDFAQITATETLKQRMGATKEDGITSAPTAVPPQFLAAPVLDRVVTEDEGKSTVAATTPSPTAVTAGPVEVPSQITLTKSDALEVSAQAAWDAYSKAVGGKAFNGDPLPTWPQLVADHSKPQIVLGWREAANAAVTAFFKSTTVEK